MGDILFPIKFYFRESRSITISNITFIKNFLKEFHHTGAILPSSPFLAKSISSKIERKDDSPLKILEAGAGTGSFTEKILRKLKPGDSFTIYEINEEFCDILKKELLDKVADGIEINLVSGDIIEETKTNNQYDYIVSGLPFNNFEPKIVEAIIAAYFKLLKKDGVLSFFEYMYVRNVKLKLPLKKDELIRIKKIDDIVLHYFNKFSGTRSFVFMNVPPAFVKFLSNS
jgi:phospholipid N-methyltransferase